MYIHITKSLFAWECLEDSPSLRTVRQALAMLPDGKLLESLRWARGKGRDDFPVEVLWGVVVLTALLRHPGIEACLGELGRNAGLREAIGIESETGVPKKWNLSRFLEVLGRNPHRTLLHEMFDAMAYRLGAIVADLGESTAGDATALNARRRSEAGSKDEAEEGLAQPRGWPSPAAGARSIRTTRAR
jgi:hypothetical protein